MSLTNTQYDTLMRKYEARQIENKHTVERRIQEVYAKAPELQELDDAISTVSLKRARLLLDGDDGALVLLKDELRQLSLEKERVLNSLGYPAGYFVPPYECPECRDTGYIGSKKCHCLHQAAIDLVYTQSNIRQILEQENFGTFDFSYYQDEPGNEGNTGSSVAAAKKAVSACHNFIQRFDEDFQNLFIYGDTGVGKTFLSNCVAKELLESGHSVIYFTAFELFHIFEKNTFHRNNAYTGDYQNLFDCDLLIIDDLGTELSNSFTSSQLFLCLNERILRKKSTIISTNLNIPQLIDIYSERTFSRVTSCFTMLKLAGLDIRIQKKLKGN